VPERALRRLERVVVALEVGEHRGADVVSLSRARRAPHRHLGGGERRRIVVQRRQDLRLQDPGLGLARARPERAVDVLVRLPQVARALVAAEEGTGHLHGIVELVRPHA
jgi:hypothetical protein